MMSFESALHVGRMMGQAVCLHSSRRIEFQDFRSFENGSV